MLGRVSYENPWVLADVDRVFYKRKNLGLSRKEILQVKEIESIIIIGMGRVWSGYYGCD